MTLRADALRVLQACPPSTARTRFLALFERDNDPTRADGAGAHITASALVVSADLDRVLLCLHGRVNRWVQLGGHCEPDDTTLAAAALREATEESGLAGLIIHPEPIDLDVHPVACRFGPSEHYDIRFAVLAPSGATPVISSESKDLAWFAPEQLPAPLADATDRLVAPALRLAAELRETRIN